MRLLLALAAGALTACSASPATTSTTATAPSVARPTASATASSSATPPPPREHLHWEVTDRGRVDVDGDGVRELALVREPLRGHHRPEIAVHFADGRVEASSVGEPFRNDGITGLPVDNRPGEELLVTDILNQTVSIWSYRDGSWQRLELAHPRWLAKSIGRDDHGYNVLTLNDQLVSWRSDEEYDVGYDYAFPPSAVFGVGAWSWHFHAGRVVPRPYGHWCVSEDIADRLIHCP